MAEIRSRWVVAVLLLSGMGAGCASEGQPAPEAPAANAEKVNALVLQLGDESYAVRQKAEDELRAIGYPAFERLARAHKDADVEVATRAKRITGDFDAINGLLDRLKTDGFTTLYHEGATETMLHLQEHGAVVAEYVGQRLASTTDHVQRFNLIDVLEQNPSPRASALLRQCVNDPHPWCRVEAVWALGNAADKESLPLLVARMKEDKDETVRKEALVAVGKIANIYMVGMAPNNLFVFSSDKWVTEEARKELERLVSYYVEHGSLPEAPQGEGDEAEVHTDSGLTLKLSALRGKGGAEWKVRTVTGNGGKSRIIVVRFDKDPTKETESAGAP